MPLFTKLGKYSNTALLLMRVGVGVMMILHGYPKILGGPDKWTKLGSNMESIGVKVYPEIWGFLAAISEGVGGCFLSWVSSSGLPAFSYSLLCLSQHLLISATETVL